MEKRSSSFIMMLFAVLSLLLMLPGCGADSNKTEERAMERLEEYAQAIDYSYKNPAKIYPLFCEEFRTGMTEEEFCAAWEKERSYPYITPLYISQPVLTMTGDGEGTAVYDRAARLIGMSYEVGIVYENGDWYIKDFEEFLDGSYLDKFDKLNYSLDWYYDEDTMIK